MDSSYAEMSTNIKKSPTGKSIEFYPYSSIRIFAIPFVDKNNLWGQDRIVSKYRISIKRRQYGREQEK